MKRAAIWAVIVAATGTLVLPARPVSAQNVSAHGVDSLHVRANLQVQFNTTSVEDAPSSEWLLRRARLGIRVWASSWTRGDLEADFGEGKARLTDGYVRLSFAPELRLQAGQYKKPFDALELTSSRELLVVERDGAPRGTSGPTPNGLLDDLGYAGRDVGLEWSGARHRAEWVVGAFNGSGANAEEVDDGKQLGARLSVEVGHGWDVTGGYAARRVSEPPDATGAHWYQASELALTGGEYGEPGLKALAQLVGGDNYDPDQGGADGATFFATQLIAAYNIAVFDVPYLIAWEPAGRLAWTDPDTDTDDDEATLVTLGVNLYHHAQLKTQFGLDILSPAVGDTETAFRVQTALAF